VSTDEQDAEKDAGPGAVRDGDVLLLPLFGADRCDARGDDRAGLDPSVAVAVAAWYTACPCSNATLSRGDDMATRSIMDAVISGFTHIIMSSSEAAWK
jgi:hypothetical protein